MPQAPSMLAQRRRGSWCSKLFRVLMLRAGKETEILGRSSPAR